MNFVPQKARNKNKRGHIISLLSRKDIDFKDGWLGLFASVCLKLMNVEVLKKKISFNNERVSVVHCMNVITLSGL